MLYDSSIRIQRLIRIEGRVRNAAAAIRTVQVETKGATYGGCLARVLRRVAVTVVPGNPANKVKLYRGLSRHCISSLADQQHLRSRRRDAGTVVVVYTEFVLLCVACCFKQDRCHSRFR